MISRLGFVLLFLTIGFFAWAGLTGFQFRVPFDTAVRAELLPNATPQKLNALVLDALAKDDIGEAEMYAEIAEYLNFVLPMETQDKMKEALSLGSAILRNSQQFGTAFITGTGDTTAGVAGALISDFTVIGDIRDITIEGGKYIAGQEYNQIILGLSVVGLAATAATVTTAGGGAVVKAGVSLLKLAKRTGQMTAEFAVALTRLVERAVDFPALKNTLRSTKLTDLKATQDAMTAYARTVKKAELFPVLARMSDINSAVGPAETMRLMKFVKSTGQLDDVAGMTARFGKKTRGIMLFTGKTAVRGFKVAYTTFETVTGNIAGWAAWLGAIGLMILARGVRLFGALRAAPSAVRQIFVRRL
ncbi:MAG TPA: hypothetical protein DCL54_14750 [Alphaproteobacteria bacterium]|nr:hypothetical protein [Alphaproteobacteria bacterium]HAJ47830.1 hypothetical protein [Alphaproteobacteria bacterium]